VTAGYRVYFTSAAAMLDRLLHRSVVITLDGASYRLRNHRAAAY